MAFRGFLVLELDGVAESRKGAGDGPRTLYERFSVNK